MNLLKRIFSKKSIDKPILNFKDGLNSDYNLLRIDVRDNFNALYDDEKGFLFDIFNILEGSLKTHYVYLSNSKYSLDKISKAGKTYILESHFEITLINWTLITNYFRNKNIRDEIGIALCYSIEHSFLNFPNIFEKSPYKSFESAFHSRSNLYPELLDLFFNPRINETSVYQDLFEVIIERPLSNNVDESDMLSSRFQSSDNKIFNSVVFKTHLAQLINDLSEKLNKIDELPLSPQLRLF